MILGHLGGCHTAHEAISLKFSSHMKFYFILSDEWEKCSLILEIYFSEKIMLPKNYMSKSLKLK